MIRVLFDTLEGILPSSLSSYDINKDEFKDLFDLARKRFTNYMDIICDYMLNERKRISDSTITSYTMEEYLLSVENNWDLTNKGTIIGHQLRLFILDKCDTTLIPYKKSSGSNLSLFVKSGWLNDICDSISVMISLADYCLLDTFSDKVNIGIRDTIWLYRDFTLYLPVFIFTVDYYITLFRCIISFSSKLSYSDFITNIPEYYYSPFVMEAERCLWNYAKSIEAGTDTDSDYVNTVKEALQSNKMIMR